MKRLDVESLPSEYVLAGGVLVDPARSVQEPGEAWVRDGRVQEVCIGGSTQAPADVLRVDLGGLVLAPGFVDVHVHFREPGQEYKEDIESGSRAAVAGGFTSVLMMPNTEPPLDNAGVVADVLRRGRQLNLCDVHCAGALTVGRGGSRLAEYDDMKRAGARALTDDGSPVADSAVMRRALEHAAMLELVVIAHSEDPMLSAGGHMHEGYWSTHLGIPGIPAAAEEIGVARDLLLARETGAPIHVAHVSTRGAVDLLRLAKESWKLDVTAETAPHYLDLNDQALSGFSTNLKMNPPIRSESDRQAIVEAVVDGTLDVIATDHAPHAEMEKDVEFERAPFGIVGLETSFGVAHTQLVTTGKLTLVELVKRMSLTPAQRFGLEAGRLAEGLPASFTLLDPEEKWQVRAEDFSSRSRNSPFLGRDLCGRVVATIFRGRVVHRAPKSTRDAVQVA